MGSKTRIILVQKKLIYNKFKMYASQCPLSTQPQPGGEGQGQAQAQLMHRPQEQVQKQKT